MDHVAEGVGFIHVAHQFKDIMAVVQFPGVNDVFVAANMVKIPAKP